MKRLFAGLLSFLVMAAVIISVVCSLSASFPQVYRITGFSSVSDDSGDWVLHTNRTEDGSSRELARLHGAGGIIAGIAQPPGFLISMLLYFLLLYMSRKKRIKDLENHTDAE